jgi:hypothetical protein
VARPSPPSLHPCFENNRCFQQRRTRRRWNRLHQSLLLNVERRATELLTDSVDETAMQLAALLAAISRSLSTAPTTNPGGTAAKHRKRRPCCECMQPRTCRLRLIPTCTCGRNAASVRCKPWQRITTTDEATEAAAVSLLSVLADQLVRTTRRRRTWRIPVNLSGLARPVWRLQMDVPLLLLIHQRPHSGA